MTAPSHAVFLSYASQDAEAARRIAEALRAFGVEVWFDQEELRGGDAWDAKIRRQIHECALFVPVISANSNARVEGYFRREWHLAAMRRQDMAEGVPFIVPVVIDETRDREAAVPDEFARVQWTRLRDGAPSAAFVEHVKRLLEAPRRATHAGATGAGRPESGEPEPAPRTRRARSVVFGTIVALSVVVAVLLVSVLWRRGARLDASADATRSIVVLPFTNMCEDKEANAAFVDGIHEDVLTNLALIRDLHVISRTTSTLYRDATKTPRQIGAELGVAYVLEGSVRRDGTRLRVTGQLIDARTDGHVWANRYDRELTDVFAIQSALAGEIADALHAVISPEEKSLLSRHPTRSVEAYDAFVRARDLHRRGINTRPRIEEAASLLASAVALDPTFATAWAELASIHAFVYSNHGDRTESRRQRASTALEHVEALAPTDPETVLAQADFNHYVLRDLDRASALLTGLTVRQPNNGDIWFTLGLVQRRAAAWQPAISSMQRAAELDASNPRTLRNFAQVLAAGRRFDEAIALLQRVLALGDEPEQTRQTIAYNRLCAGQSTVTEANWFAQASPDMQLWWAYENGNFEEVVRLSDTLDEATRQRRALWIGTSLLALGRRDEARTAVESSRSELLAQLAATSEDPMLLTPLARLECVAGDYASAIAHLNRAIELDPRNRYDSAFRLRELAWVRAWSGDIEGALRDYALALREPNGANVHRLRRTALPEALRRDPRFQALLDDPKNNAPLF